jgi:LPXTG-site transpeptidase (sortase) family protein
VRSARAQSSVLVGVVATIALGLTAVVALRSSPAVPVSTPSPATLAGAAPVLDSPVLSLRAIPKNQARLPQPISADAAAVAAGHVPVPVFRIRIPKIGLDAPTYEGVDLGTLSSGPGHWPGSAQPGQAGNMVIGGHRVTWTHPFFDLDRLVPGDVVETGSSRYVVTRVFIVNADDVWITSPTPEPTLTLFACHPKYSAAQRIVATARLSISA